VARPVDRNTMITGQVPTGDPTPIPTQAPVQSYVVFGDTLSLHWYDQSWTATVNYAASSPVHSGSNSISYSATAGWAALQLRTNSNLSTAPYSCLSFAMQATQAGQKYGVYLRDSSWKNLTGALPLTLYGGNPVPSQWALYTIPLADLKGVNASVSNIVFQSFVGTNQPAVYLDEIKLVQI
jgi:hypothetical protein